MFDLSGPVQFVKGIGPQRAEALAKAGVRTVEDLLHHLPLRYEDRRQFARIADLRPGMKIAVAGTIAVAGLRRARRMSLYEIRLDDPMPPDLRAHRSVVGRGEALRRLHLPGPDEDVALLNAARGAAHRRLILEELFLFQLGLALRRRGVRQRRKGIAFEVTDRARDAVKRILPFHLTAAQKRVLRQIAEDMKSPHPMNRLVQGDVGCGKTMVALLSMVIAVENGHQAAFMAPTEILAEQHFLTFRRLLSRCPYRVELLSAALKGSEKAAALARVDSGEAQIVVGTHALIQEGVRFRRLGLAVVDEQHRFGVLQREDLIRKGYDADVLVMTATPIPRTLALTAYGDLDVSVVDERPPGRRPITTVQRRASERRAIVDLVRSEVGGGRQAYVVYPLVEESEKLEDVRAATQMAEEWRGAPPGAPGPPLHGRMKSAEKEKGMGDFSSGARPGLGAATRIGGRGGVPDAPLRGVGH